MSPADAGFRRRILASAERRNPYAAPDLVFRLLAQLQVFEVHVIGKPTSRAHQAIKHLP
jgi:hypothetical protein